MRSDITRFERDILKALHAARGLEFMTAADLKSAHPVTFESHSPAGISLAASRLVRKGLVERSYARGGGIAAFHIRQAGEEVLRS